MNSAFIFVEIVPFVLIYILFFIKSDDLCFKTKNIVLNYFILSILLLFLYFMFAGEMVENWMAIILIFVVWIAFVLCKHKYIIRYL
jgi:hypothetical protein